MESFGLIILIVGCAGFVGAYAFALARHFMREDADKVRESLSDKAMDLRSLLWRLSEGR